MLITGEVTHMSPIPNTTAMTIKSINVWDKDFPFSSYDFSAIQDNGVENQFDIGIVGKVFRRLRCSYKGNFVNSELWKGDIKCLLLICCGPDSDFSYKTALSLEGLPIKLKQKPGEVNLYVITSFDDVIDKAARNHLRDIDTGKKELIPFSALTSALINEIDNSAEEEDPVGTTATGPINNVDNSAEEEDPIGTTATGPLDEEIQDKNEPVPHKDSAEKEFDYIDQNFSKKEIIVGLKIHYFLNSLNLPFFNHGN